MLDNAMDKLDRDDHPAVAATRDALRHPRKGTMRAWFADREGSEVELFQWTYDPDGDKVVGVWTPGPRIVTDVAGTYVLLDGSRTDYVGTRVVAASEGTLVTRSPWGAREHVSVYRAV